MNDTSPEIAEMVAGAPDGVDGSRKVSDGCGHVRCRTAHGVGFIPTQPHRIGDETPPFRADLWNATSPISRGAVRRSVHRRGVVHEFRWGGWNSSRHESLMRAAVICEIMAHGADECKFVGDPRVAWEKFTDLDARDIGADGREVAPNLAWGVGLHVVGVEMSGSARKPHEDHSRVLRSLARGGSDRLEPEGISKTQSEKSQSARFEKTST